MDQDGAAEATPLQLALDGFGTALDHLVKIVDDGALEDLDGNGMVAFLQGLEQVRNRVPVIDHAAIGSAVRRELPNALCRRTMNQVLMSALRLSPGEAARRVRSAEHLADRTAMTGEPLGPWRPHLAAAQRRGEVTPEQVSVIDKALRHVDGRGFEPADVEAGELILVDTAAAVGPKDLDNLAGKVVEAIDPDGTLPDDQLQQDRRYFRLRRHADGSFRGEFRLAPEVGAKLKAILEPLAVPNTTRFDLTDPSTFTDPSTLTDPSTVGGQPTLDDQPTCADDASDPAGATCAVDAEGFSADDARRSQSNGGGEAFGAPGSDPSARSSAGSSEAGRAAQLDERSHGQRMHDALHMLCDRFLRAGGQADCGGVPATVVISIDLHDVQTRAGVGHFSDGTPVPAQTVIDLADQADLAWCVKNSKGAVLSLGRSQRIATRPQTLALIARDGGCSFPGCDVAPEWCERHHVVSWADGGTTDLTNLTLLCRFHHANFGGRGWTCRINRDGLPEWTPPRWIDRHQHPILHPRIKIMNWKPQDPLPGHGPAG